MIFYDFYRQTKSVLFESAKIKTVMPFHQTFIGDYMKKITFFFAVLLSQTAFSLDQTAGPISKFPDSSVEQIRKAPLDKMIEAYVVFGNTMTQAELNTLAATYNVKVFASQDRKEATVIGYLANIVTLTAKPGISRIEVGHFNNSGSARLRVDYVGMGSAVPLSDFRDIGRQNTPINQSGPRTLQALERRFGGTPSVIGEINFIDPIISYQYGWACAGKDSFDSSILQVTTSNATGNIAYHYVYVHFSSNVSLYAQNNLPVIEFGTNKRCIPRQTITAAELGLISLGE
jgi:hypothetical protein